MANPRKRMVVSTALLIRERGAHATAISDVLEHSGAPKGSAYHYFPGGRAQLICEAVDYAGDHIAAAIERAGDSLELVDSIFAAYRKELMDTHFRAGCPVAAVAVEAGEPTGAGKEAAAIDRAAAAFQRWTALAAGRLTDDGVPAERAEELAVMLLAGIEGAILLARTRRDIEPFDIVRSQMRALVAEATQPGKGTRHA